MVKKAIGLIAINNRTCHHPAQDDNIEHELELKISISSKVVEVRF